MITFLHFCLIFLLPSWKQVFACSNNGPCRKLVFPSLLFFADKRLLNHGITTLQVKDLDECELRCYYEPNCVSINFEYKTHTSEKYICELNNSTHGEHDGDLVQAENYFYRGTKNACSNCPCKNNGTCQSGFTKKGYQCLCPSGWTGGRCQDDIDECDEKSHGCSENARCKNTKGSYRCSCKTGFYGDGYNCTDPCGTVFDFENGLSGWQLNGAAFNNQPTYGDNPTARKREPSNHRGNWWIGGYENRPSPSHKAGIIQGDGPTGSMTSPSFVIGGNSLSFLIGGSCDLESARAELIVAGIKVFRETGGCSETMTEKNWNVSSYTGKQAQLRLIDNSKGSWGHINFDHLICQ